MLTLGIDSSSVACSAAVCDTEKNIVLAGTYLNAGIPHSATLIKMLENMLRTSGIRLCDIERIAVTTGPGSFTGLRIALSAVKGMAFAMSAQVTSVSTLSALAVNLLGNECIACPVMDARRSQVYNALFRIENDKIERLTHDRALSLEELHRELAAGYSGERVVVLGDGAKLLGGIDESLHTAPPMLCYQNAVSVCFAEGETVSLNRLNANYLRIPQAQRELKGRK